MSFKARILTILLAPLLVGFFAVGTASAHVPDYTAKCGSLSVTADWYPSNSTVDVTIDGVASHFVVSGQWSKTFPLSKTAQHPWSIVIVSSDGDHRFDRNWSGTIAACETPPTTTTTTTTTTTLPPTTTTTTTTTTTLPPTTTSTTTTTTPPSTTSTTTSTTSTVPATTSTAPATSTTVTSTTAAPTTTSIAPTTAPSSSVEQEPPAPSTTVAPTTVPTPSTVTPQLPKTGLGSSGKVTIALASMAIFFGIAALRIRRRSA